MKRSRYDVLLLFLIIMLLLAGCSGLEGTLPENNIEENTKEDIGDDNTDEIESGIFEGDEIKDFYIEDNKGNGISAEDILGKVTILNFWTSWSLESEVANTVFSECNDIFNDSIHIVSINVTAVEGHNLEYVIKYIRSKGYNFPVYFDLEGDVAKQYLIRSFPTTYIIDTNGVITNIYIGEINKKEFINEIRNLIDE